MALFARDRDRYQLDRGGTIVAEHGPKAPPRPVAYPNERAAVVVFRKRVVELMREGWQLVRPDADIGAPIAADSELETALRESRDVDELAVYNDWLIERGDPCGELAGMRARRDPELASAIAQLEKQRGYELYGSYADWLLVMPKCGEHVGFVWNAAGWIEGLELRRRVSSGCPQPDATLAALLLQAPMARFLRRLVVLGESQLWTFQSALEHASRRDTIRELVVGAPAMAGLATALPQLESLSMPPDAPTQAGHAGVRELTIAVHGIVKDLVIGQWPSVRRLTIRCTGDPTVIEPALERLRLDRLPHLHELQVDAQLDEAMLGRVATMVNGFQLKP